MKINKSKLALCLFAASAVSVSFISNASTFGTPDTGVVTFSIVPAATSSILDLKAEASLPPGGVMTNDGTVVATATNTITGGVQQQSGIRFTPNYTGQTVDQGNEIVTLAGTTSTNKVVLKMITAGANVATWKTINDDSYYVTNSPVTSQKLSIGLSGSQSIPVDTYNLSMDGVTYTN